MEDDIFDEDASEMSIIERDWMKMKDARIKAAYVSGSLAGEEASREKGLLNGLQQGFLSAFLLSKIRGVITALLAYRTSYEGHPITDDIILDAELLLEDLSTLETDRVAEDFLTMKLNPPTQQASEITEVYEEEMSELSMEVDKSEHCSSNCSNLSQDCSANVNEMQTTLNHPENPVSSNTVINNKFDIQIQDAQNLLFTCPQIADAVNRCKKILKRLKWTDAMIDELF